ncbi:flagellin [Rugamonas sp. CCM 8940]|uniref:flagellin N-terminal helical domain-containing protein n=1 Tax=Rugamonas sp. CCM 8940 TaxID=2765359 RepID=UPI0018F46E83|nr:flagellin [Rugamonas sp. CCM 8940]MBJ7311540.1 flagellin [Rugamonas sp. CCM 8940]
MQINTNLPSLNAQRHYQRSGDELSVSLRRLSSGLRINSARDDAAGLAISERFTAAVRGGNQAARNINDGISLVQVAEGALGQIINNFQRIRELAVQAANGSNNALDRASIQTEVDALVATNYQINDSTSFNQMNLIDGSLNTQLQVGANVGDIIQLNVGSALRQRHSGRGMADVPLLQVNLSGLVAGALGAGALLLNGVAVGAAVAGAAPGQTAASAYAAANAINAANVAGVSASASTSVVGVAGGGGAIGNATLSINGVALGAINGANAGALALSAANAINGAGAGVTAGVNGGTLTLTAADGRDVDLVGAGWGLLGVAPGTARGSITILDTADTAQHSLSVGGSNPGLVGLALGSVRATPNGATVHIEATSSSGEPAIDLSSFAGATAALDYIDGKLDEIGVVRSGLGAMQNRLDAAHAGALDRVENLSAARSRILDTDYASEMAQLTRAQILQQAGASMLAQANVLPNQALQLLR